MHNRPLTYLAVPYTYECPDARVKKLVQQFRYETATRAAGWLMTAFGYNVFSPITHSHPMHVLCPEVRGDWEFWKRIDTEYLECSERIIILTLPGWQKSTGVTAELKIAEEMNLMVRYIHPRMDGAFEYTGLPTNPITLTVPLS